MQITKFPQIIRQTVQMLAEDQLTPSSRGRLLEKLTSPAFYGTRRYITSPWRRSGCNPSRWKWRNRQISDETKHDV